MYDGTTDHLASAVAEAGKTRDAPWMDCAWLYMQYHDHGVHLIVVVRRPDIDVSASAAAAAAAATAAAAAAPPPATTHVSLGSEGELGHTIYLRHASVGTREPHQLRARACFCWRGGVLGDEEGAGLCA